MKWSWKLGEVAGIGIYVHATFLLLLGWVALSHYLAGQSIAMMLNGIVFLLALFGIVVLHELGHALTAKRFGIPTRDITLLPIGGVARLERMPDDPKQELWVALAGPAVNVALAAVLFIVLRLSSGVAPLSQFNLVFIALFVWMGATQEASMVQMKSSLGGIPIQRAMIKDFRTLSPSDSLARAVEHVLDGFQQDFPVVEDGRVVGVLTRNDLLKTLSQRGPEARVEEAMQRQFETADPNEMLESVFARLNACRCHSLPLVRNGQLAGLITMDNLGEFLMIQSALRGARA
ncbi:site-2 protease family protein [candidate division KSB1 bacterium]|nr:site-2 protease family protein [candidate division KSB1 bacterium]